MGRIPIASRAGSAALVLAIASVVLAWDEPSRSDPSAKPWKEVASTYRIKLEPSIATPLTFREEPVLKWTNPERKTDDGAIFVWTDRGRPEVAACFYRYKAEGIPTEDHEFISLSTSPLSAERDKEPIWEVGVANVRPMPIPDASRPATSANERLRQMRALARDFKATFNNPPDLSEIRLLTQPIYRFETEGKRTDVVDGALFAFVHTTDPEILLIIEARPKVEGGPAIWQYSLARMSMVNMRVHHKEKEVWSARWATDLGDPSNPYMVRSLRSAR